MQSTPVRLVVAVVDREVRLVNCVVDIPNDEINEDGTIPNVKKFIETELEQAYLEDDPIQDALNDSVDILSIEVTNLETHKAHYQMADGNRALAW